MGASYTVSEYSPVSKRRRSTHSFLRALAQANITPGLLLGKEFQQMSGHVRRGLGGQPVAAVGKVMDFLRAKSFSVTRGDVGIAVAPKHAGGNTGS